MTLRCFWHDLYQDYHGVEAVWSCIKNRERHSQNSRTTLVIGGQEFTYWGMTDVQLGAGHVLREADTAYGTAAVQR